MFVAEAMKETEDDFFVAMADLDAFNVRGFREREAGEAVCQETERGAIYIFAGAIKDDW